MLDRKAQSSFEALLLLALIFLGALYIFSLFFQLSDATLAMQLAKIAVMEKLSALNKFYSIQKIDFAEKSTQTGTDIELTVSIFPTDHGLTESSFSSEQALIAGKTKYQNAKIKPV